TEEPDSQMIQFLPKMKTDIVLKNGDKTLIIDAKYYGKSMAQGYSKETLRSAHLYQIFAYVKNMDTANTGNVSGLLLYAKTEDEVFPEGEPYVIGGNRIGARTLDLNQKFDKIANRLESIVKHYFV
ncbi:MAG: 5-methylcytosine-specific restriction endonuclease system specificity protein McrC, partial [Oscillospiraceae bacterium]|nr:5-methylcytosine-specific restriction endonuclease system specificity protein McrC [Oscillospiraceae bacterium]